MSIFTKVINREIPGDFVYEDEICVGIRDITPQAPTHILVIPHKEIPSLAEANEGDKNTLGHMLWVCSQIAKNENISEDGYRIVINTNGHGCQSVQHIHMHILGGRQLTWPAG